MSINKRGRGRPVGTGLNDTPTLEQAADLMVAHPGVKVTTAVRQILPKAGPSEIRRLQMKWKAKASEYLANASARLAAPLAPVRTQRASTRYSARTARQIMEAHQKMQEAISPTIRAVQEVMNSPAMRAAGEAASRFHQSPAMRAIEEYRNSPTMRAMEELQNSPTMKAMRELHNSPSMRAVREAAQQVASIQLLIKGNGF